MAQHLPMERFDRNALQALANTTQRKALARATDLFGARRKQALAGVPDWEALRERARRVKEETLERLDVHLEHFATAAEHAGMRVHWACDGAEACQIVRAIARELDAELVVKSKSMTTEEIRLNEALEEAGIECVETDLGEWIVQLAHETPSHIIVPAIHKTKQEIAELFAREIGTERDAGVEALARAAREILRRKFAAADLGISGVNFAVAETGTLLIVENEGNARFTTTLPRTHVAVMGIEKVLPRFADLEVFLELLPRSGTGQRMTSYLSLLSGPKARLADEGPDEVHVILLDNGRSAMLAHPVTRQSLACIRCGACLNACPVYREVGGHAYGSVYPGPIGAIITPQLAGLAKATQLPFASSLCGACRDVCPVKIDLPEVLLHLRGAIRESAGGEQPAMRSESERRGFGIWAWFMASERRYRWAARFARLLQRGRVRDGRIARAGGLAAMLFPRLAAWTQERDLRPIAPRSFRKEWRERLAKDGR